MNEQLIVKNFGPIKDATVDFKRVTVFIGPTGGGKSTLAKLAAIFRNFIKLGASERNEEVLDYYQIASFAQNASTVDWIINKLCLTLRRYDLVVDNTFQNRVEEQVELAHKNLSEQGGFPSLTQLKVAITNKPKRLSDDIRETYIKILDELTKTAIRAVMPIIQVHYTPAERVYLPSITRSLAALMRDNFNLPKTLLEFINQFISARYEVGQLPVDFLKVNYELRGDDDVIFDKNSKIKLALSETASGIQSVTPLLVLLEHLSRNTEQAQSFIIEEPELNLYPTAQQGLLNWLVEKCTKGENDLTITTHSPYILSSCNLLLEAYKVAQQRPDLEAEIAAIVPKACWLNPEEFAAYYVADGTVKPITDERTHLIGGNELDSVSGDISDSFRKLLRLKKQVA